MPVYTVHQPPLRRDGSDPGPERFVLVRDGFHFWAFVIAPLWLLWHRLWLAFVGYVVLAVALEVGIKQLTRSDAAVAAVAFLLALLVGLEASTLRRWTLARRGWTQVGTVVADDRDGAERRFFDAWAPARKASAPPANLPGTANLPSNTRGPDVVGLFPEPGGAR